MNKFIKVSLIVAAVLLGVGLLFSAIGMFGAKKEIKRLIKEEVITQDKIEMVTGLINGEDIHLDLLDEDINIQIGDGAKELKVNGVVISDSSEAVLVDADSVKNLDLELGAGSFTIEEKTAADGKIEISFDGLGNCDYRIEEETLYVEGFKGLSINTYDVGIAEIVLKVPAGSVFEEAEIKVGAGEMIIEDLSVREMETEIGAGELEMKKLEADTLAVKIGAGRVETKDTVVKDAEISVAMGECVFKGTINGNLDADCDMGNMQFELTGKESDHNYDVSCSAGNIEIGGFQFAALAADREIDNGTESTFEVKCSMGNIGIHFEE